jgi:hypothetical protein
MAAMVVSVVVVVSSALDDTLNIHPKLGNYTTAALAYVKRYG